MRPIFVIIFIFLLISIYGCGFNNKPRVRLGAYFGAPLGIAYPDPNRLGKQSYSHFWGERIGLVYTSKGGFIDLGHLRDAADRMKYCADFTYKNLISEQTEFNLKLMEPSKFYIKIKYPQNWDSTTDKDKIARNVSIEAGKYLAYNSMVWHEIITWYGYKYTVVFSEYISSFSWEDVYSDIVGIQIAGKALEDDPNNYESVMTKLIYDELRYLDVQPVSVAKRAEKKIRGKWYKGTIYPFTKLKKRNLDIGIDDGYVTPWLVPGVCANTEPIAFAVPNLDVLKEYGFSIDVKIDPVILEERKILRVIYPGGNGKYVVPSRDFPGIMRDITDKEKKRNGSEVNIPKL